MHLCLYVSRVCMYEFVCFCVDVFGMFDAYIYVCIYVYTEHVRAFVGFCVYLYAKFCIYLYMSCMSYLGSRQLGTMCVYKGQRE